MKKIIFCISILCLIATTFSWTTSRFNSEFIIELWKNHEFPEPNLVVSSYAIISPLCVLALASSGSTRKEIFDTLGFNNLDEMTEEYRREVARIKVIKKTMAIKAASTLYVDEKLQIKPLFEATIDDLYDVRLVPVNFKYPERIADQINVWVKKELKNLGDKSIFSAKSISKKNHVLLMNTIYFRGYWKTPFTDAGNQPFQITETKSKNKPTMSVTSKMPYIYVENMRSQLILIPFKHSKCSLMIILPDKHMELSHKHYTVDHRTKLNNATRHMTHRLLTITIPKLKIETTFNPIKTLKKARVEKVFSKGYRLDDMLAVPQKLFVNQAYQKTFVNMEESGINTGDNPKSSLRSKKQKRAKILEINRPFYFEVGCHDTTLINGIIMNPAYE